MEELIQIAILGAVTGIIRAGYNWAVWCGKGTLWHTLQGAFIGTVVVGLSYLLPITVLPYQNWINALIVSFIFLTPHWITMDGFYNLFRKQNWFYNNKEGDSFLDKM